MNPTDVLKNEHRVIERVLAVLDRACQKLERGDEVKMSVFTDAVDFVRNFADKLHHGKEEGKLFPLMNELGGEAGLIMVMLEDHEQGREYIGRLAAAVERYEAGDASAMPVIINNATGYVTLLKGHIEREDLSLFPAAEDIMEKEDKQQLDADFKEVDAELMGEKGHQKYYDLVAWLERAVG